MRLPIPQSRNQEMGRQRDREAGAVPGERRVPPGHERSAHPGHSRASMSSRKRGRESMHSGSAGVPPASPGEPVSIARARYQRRIREHAAHGVAGIFNVLYQGSIRSGAEYFPPISMTVPVMPASSRRAWKAIRPSPGWRSARSANTDFSCRQRDPRLRAAGTPPCTPRLPAPALARGRAVHARRALRHRYSVRCTPTAPAALVYVA